MQRAPINFLKTSPPQLLAHFSHEQLLIHVTDPAQQFLLGTFLFEQKNQERRAIFWIQEAAKNGNKLAQYNLARLLMSGHIVTKDAKKAIGWYTKAAAQGLAVAQYDLANFYLTGQAVTVNKEKAFHLFKQAASQGNIDAKVALGICYMEGKETEKDEEKAVNLFNEIVEKNIKARRLLGVCYEKGIWVEEDQKQAFEYYLWAAQEEDAEAQWLVANRLLQGRGVEQNEMAAMDWLEAAANNDYADAQYQLAFICREGRWGTEKNQNQAFTWFKCAADQGHAAAQNSLALCYEQGVGTSQDHKNAAIYYQKSAEQGNRVAQFNLAAYYYWGKGVEKDLKKAFHWYLEAALQGDGDAQLMVAKCLITGEGTIADKLAANDWIRKATNQKEPKAVNMQENKISYNIDLIKAQAPANKVWRIHPDQLPLISQSGPNCGLVAVAAAFNLAAINYDGDQRPYPIVYATECEKMAAGQDINIKEDILLYQLNEMGRKGEIKEAFFSTEGAIFDCEIFHKLAQHYGIKNCEAVIKGNYTEEEYETAVINALENNKLLVVACDSKYGMPANDKGLSAHWVFVPDYWYDDNKHVKLLVDHTDIYGIWPIDDVWESCNQMEIKNPHKKDGDLTKFRYTFFTVPMLPSIANETNACATKVAPSKK